MQDTADTVAGISVFHWSRFLNFLLLDMVPLLRSLYSQAIDPLHVIGLVSSCTNHTAPQGGSISRCTLLSVVEAVAKISQINGDKSVCTDYDFELAFCEHLEIAIIDSEVADYLEIISASFQRNKYTAYLKVRECIACDNFECKMLSRGTMVAFDVALQPESA